VSVPDINRPDLGVWLLVSTHHRPGYSDERLDVDQLTGTDGLQQVQIDVAHAQEGFSSA
jgi:hypothetical protein